MKISLEALKVHDWTQYYIRAIPSMEEKVPKKLRDLIVKCSCLLVAETVSRGDKKVKEVATIAHKEMVRAILDYRKQLN